MAAVVAAEDGRSSGNCHGHCNVVVFVETEICLAAVAVIIVAMERGDSNGHVKPHPATRKVAALKAKMGHDADVQLTCYLLSTSSSTHYPVVFARNFP